MKKYYLLSFVILFVLSAKAYTKVITGNVTDSEKIILYGVNIIEKGTTNGVTSGLDGKFRITTKSDSPTLIFSYIGYETKEINVSDVEILSVVLEESSTELGAVSVKGFSGVLGNARRRVQSVQKIPEAVVAYNFESIENIGIQNIETFAAIVPNVSFNKSQNIGVNFINVRGIPQIRNGESPVAFVVDGVNIPDANLINQDLFDLALIEVVKGPQGTLYGKNAIGGAINIISKKPTNKFQNRISLGIGNGNNQNIIGQTSGAIIKDMLFFRLAGRYRNFDGLFTNKTLDKKVDFSEAQSYRGLIRIEPSKHFQADLNFQYSKETGGATYYAKAVKEKNLPPNKFTNRIDADVLGKSKLESSFGSLKMTYNLNSFKIQSVSSYNKADRNHFGDLDMTSANVLTQYQESNTESFNQEIRLISTNNSSLIDWDLGGFYQKYDKELVTNATFIPLNNMVLVLSDFYNRIETFAFFGLATINATKELKFTVGLRYDNDKITQINRQFNTKPSKTDSEIQPKLSISYNFSNNIMAYANYGRGYRNGGYNADTTAVFNADYNAETSNSYELGLKSSYLKNRLILNLAGFYTDFNNQQQYYVSASSKGLILGNYNYDKTEIFGFELDLKYRATKFFDLLASYGLNHSKIKEGGKAGRTDRKDFNGNFVGFIPLNSYNLGINSDIKINNDFTLINFINLQHKGNIYWFEDNRDVADSYRLLDFRTTLKYKKSIDIAIWGNNILDQDYYQEYYPSHVSNSAAGDLGWIGQPATFGVELTFKF